MAQLRNLCVANAKCYVKEEVEFVERKINKICVYIGIYSLQCWYGVRKIDFSGGIFMVIKENVILINYKMVLIVFRSYIYIHVEQVKKKLLYHLP